MNLKLLYSFIFLFLMLQFEKIFADVSHNLPPMTFYISLSQNANPNIYASLVSELQKNGNYKKINFENLFQTSLQGETSIDQAKSIFEGAMGNLKSFKFWVAATGATLLSSYLLVLYKLKKAEWVLGKTDLWSFWKSEKNIFELASMNEKEFIELLLFEIQAKYTSINAVNDYSTPLGLFFKNIDLEVENIEMYVWLSSKIKQLHLTKIFPIDEKIILGSADRINKLTFLRSKIWNWISKQKAVNSLESL
ncbi:TPA: hypothetical protein DEO28_01430 [Candidatus Dependentiae bacterium]|nr:MAG: hypothetical protein UR14_C0003G0134 [candidate division TM6 bacterium GW2011_GWE2_31_21]KKP53702.1 MAG: hypothetical protein UR43_C0003G0023 [candidate division TM6 bacterium GW2011_GWF2_33_332]HBS48546.1 hypothetical protein [Candidatus Dependentiae bacterium]HBZ73161.1 hypothetical protein [Candidatus Dependentiae bacterium]